MVLPILTVPNPILKTKNTPLTREEILHPKTRKLIKDLAETMNKAEGVGIAGPQVGQSMQVCVIAAKFTPDKKKDLVLINPAWKKDGLGKIWDEEGCLSVPNIYGKVKRYKKIKVSALNEKAEKIEFAAVDFSARVIQHEIDHLNGVLFTEKAKDLHEVHKE